MKKIEITTDNQGNLGDSMAVYFLFGRLEHTVLSAKVINDYVLFEFIEGVMTQCHRQKCLGATTEEQLAFF